MSKKRLKTKATSKTRRTIDNHIYRKFLDSLCGFWDLQRFPRFPTPPFSVMCYQTEEYMRLMNGELYSSKL